jgi:hypothetical protein
MFKIETLIKCEIQQLDEIEIMYIAKYKTLYPLGYNLTEGGKCCRMSNLTRKHDTFDLPYGIYEINIPARKKHGFAISLGPGIRGYAFTSKYMNIEEKKKLAYECFNSLKSGQTYTNPNIYKKITNTYELPMYVIKDTQFDNSFKFNRPRPEGLKRKTFRKVDNTLLQNRQDAINYAWLVQKYVECHNQLVNWLLLVNEVKHMMFMTQKKSIILILKNNFQLERSETKHQWIL